MEKMLKEFHCMECKKPISDETLMDGGTGFKVCPYCTRFYVVVPLSGRTDLEEVDWVSVIKYGIKLE